MALAGNNKLKLNHATICQAVQHWLNDKVFKDAETVTSVTFSPNAGMAAEFIVELSEEKPK